MFKKMLTFWPEMYAGEGLRVELKKRRISQKEVEIRAAKMNHGERISPAIVSTCLNDRNVWLVRKAAEDLMKERVWEDTKYIAILNLQEHLIVSVSKTNDKKIALQEAQTEMDSWHLDVWNQYKFPDQMNWDVLLSEIVEVYDADKSQTFVMIPACVSLENHWLDNPELLDHSFEIRDGVAVHVQ